MVFHVRDPGLNSFWGNILNFKKLLLQLPISFKFQLGKTINKPLHWNATYFYGNFCTCNLKINSSEHCFQLKKIATWQFAGDKISCNDKVQSQNFSFRNLSQWIRDILKLDKYTRSRITRIFKCGTFDSR